MISLILVDRENQSRPRIEPPARRMVSSVSTESNDSGIYGNSFVTNMKAVIHPETHNSFLFRFSLVTRGRTVAAYSESFKRKKQANALSMFTGEAFSQ